MTDFDPTMSANDRLRERLAQDASDDAGEIADAAPPPMKAGYPLRGRQMGEYLNDALEASRRSAR